MKMKRSFTLLSTLMVLLLLVVACATPAEAPTDTEDNQEPATEPTAEVMDEEPADEPMDEEPADEPMDEEPADEPMDEMRTDNLEGETITFYHFGDLSGPYAGITAPLINGFEDAVAAVNENGGIRGAEVELKFTDTGGSIDEAVAAYERYQSEDDNVLVMFTYGSGEAEALASRFVEDDAVNLAAGLSSVGFYGPESGNTFGYAPIYPDQFGLFLEFITENWDEYKPEGAGDEIKLAYISWPTAFGQGAYTDETLAYAESLGVEIVLNENIDVSPTADATTAILNAEAAGANVIWTNTLAFGPASVMNALGALDKRDQFVLAGANWTMDLATYAFVSDPALAEGLIAPFPNLYWNDVDHPGVQAVNTVFEANGRSDSERAVGYLLTFAGVDLAVQAIELAIDTVGYDNLDGEAIKQAMIDLGAVDLLDGVMRVDFSTNDSRSPHMAQIRQIQGGPSGFVVLQDWTETPDLRPAENFSE